METKEIIYYKQYVHIIINQALIKETVLAHMNNIHKYLEFKMREEVNKQHNKLSRRAHIHHNNIQLRIYRKPTYTVYI